MRPFHVVAAALATSLSAPGYPQDDLAEVGWAIRHSLDWETRWYGEPFGKSCVDKALASGAKIHARTLSRLQAAGLDCQSGKPAAQPVRMFEAAFDDAPIFFVGQLDGLPRADLSDGERNDACVITEDDLKRRRIELQQKGRLAQVPLPRSTHPTIPSADLTAYAWRSVRSWARGKSASIPASLRIGLVVPGDPYLVIRMPADPNAYLLPVVDIKHLGDQAFCGPLYSANRFSGRDSTSMHHHLNNDDANFVTVPGSE